MSKEAKKVSAAERRGLANGERLVTSRPSLVHENKPAKKRDEILKKEIKDQK